MRFTEDNYLSEVIDNLKLLLTALDNEEITTMTYDGDKTDKAGNIRELINYLQKTN